MVFWGFLSGLLLSALVLGAAKTSRSPDQRTVSSVDLKRYAGRWFEIARLPNRFQKKCWGDVQAEYEVRPDGAVGITNRCREKSPQGEISTFRAKGTVIEPKTNAKLKVSASLPFLPFVRFSTGEYWILELDPAYQYAVVGSSDPKYLWILSRAPQMSDARYRELIGRLQERGYPVEQIQRTPQQATRADSL